MARGVVTLLVALWAAAPAAAAPGELDTAFGSGGTVTTGFGAGDDFASDVLVQPDGRIVAAGWATVADRYDFAVVRYLPDGQPDPSFSEDGKLTLDFTPGHQYDRASAVARQPDGKLVVAGASDGFAVARFQPDGTLDETFSDDGLQTIDIGAGGGSVSDVAIDTEGRIVLVGVASSPWPISNNDAAYARLTPGGELDSSFSGDGMLLEDLTYDGGDTMAAVAAVEDGGFLAVGSAAHVGQPGVVPVIRRFTESGDHAPGFGDPGGGREVVSAHDVQVLSDGRIAIAGAGDAPASVGAVRLLPNGRYDPSFSGDGEETAEITASAPLPGNEVGTAVASQPSGRIVVGVAVYPDGAGYHPTSAFGLVRFRAGGGLDTSFAGDGRQATRIGSGASLLQAIALQGANGIIAAGTAGIGTGNSDFALARYDGSVFDPDAPGSAANRGPDSNIRKPGRRLRAGRPIRFRGTASDDAGVAKVQVALQRLTPVRKGRRVCRWLRNRRSQLSRKVIRARRSCAGSRTWLPARGTRRWSYRLRRGVPAGRYVLYSRATDTTGATERRFSARDRNRLAFRVRRPATRPSGA